MTAWRDVEQAVHGPTFHPVEGREADWPGEAKIAGRAVPAAGGGEADMFRADISEVVVTHLNPEATLVVALGSAFTERSAHPEEKQ
jgi:hypothetical protein